MAAVKKKLKVSGKAKGKTAKKAVARKAARPAPAAKSGAARERFGLIELGGKPATVVGDDVAVGQDAPEFHAHANDWSDFYGLKSTAGKVRIFTPLPSLSTSTCDRETRTFNERASELGDQIVVVTVSTDLPPTQKMWCGSAGVERVITVSDHLDADFGIKYGTLLKERRWHRRAVFVVDRNDKVTYAAYMPALGMEPNYDEVIAAAQAAAAA
jgi:thiol peroxidase